MGGGSQKYLGHNRDLFKREEIEGGNSTLREALRPFDDPPSWSVLSTVCEAIGGPRALERGDGQSGLAGGGEVRAQCSRYSCPPRRSGTPAAGRRRVDGRRLPLPPAHGRSGGSGTEGRMTKAGLEPETPGACGHPAT